MARNSCDFSILALCSRQDCQSPGSHSTSRAAGMKEQIELCQDKFLERSIGLAKTPSFSEPISTARGMESLSLARPESCV